jgi:transposase
MAIFVGIDVGKDGHIAGFISSTLLEQHKRFTSCPSFAFPNDRGGFDALLARMQQHGPLADCHVLMESTGHYHRALEQFLQENGVTIYIVAAQVRLGRDKSDKRDALGLANLLYSQVEKEVQPSHPSQRVRRLEPPTEAALVLRGLVRRRYELDIDITRHKNRLTALADELFPEFTRIFKDPNTPTALSVRTAFPTPADVAAAPLDDLLARRVWRRPSKAEMEKLQKLARESVGVKNQQRLRGLRLEQEQLITELNQLLDHRDKLEAEIGVVVDGCREGMILTSLPPIGKLLAASVIASIGHIANFATDAQLRAYFGWAPRQDQTGKTRDSSTLTAGGNHQMKKTMYLITLQAIRLDTEWRALYERLVPVKCSYDPRKGRYLGRNKVMGRVAGQIVGTIHALLMKDYQMLSSLEAGAEVPPPTLYDRAVHHAHRTSHPKTPPAADAPDTHPLPPRLSRVFPHEQHILVGVS